MCWMSLLRSLGELLCNVFYKHYAPLALRNQRVCQRYPKPPHFIGSAVHYLDCAHPDIGLHGCAYFSMTIRHYNRR